MSAYYQTLFIHVYECESAEGRHPASEVERAARRHTARK